MPYKVVCHYCHHTLYSGTKPPRLYDIYVRYGGRCPHCDRKISWKPRKVTVRPVRPP